MTQLIPILAILHGIVTIIMGLVPNPKANTAIVGEFWPGYMGLKFLKGKTTFETEKKLAIVASLIIGLLLIIGGFFLIQSQPIGKIFLAVGALGSLIFLLVYFNLQIVYGIVINLILIAFILLLTVGANVPFHTNIETDTLQNTNYRKVLFTGNLQLVLMSLHTGEEVGLEVHTDHDQFFRIEEGDATAVLNGVNTELHKNDVLIVPAGTYHNIINTGPNDLKLYTIYAPPEHPAGTLEPTKP